MEMQFSPEMQSFVAHQIKSGSFASEQKLIEAALSRFKAEKENQYNWLQAQLESSQLEENAGIFVFQHEIEEAFAKRWNNT